MGSNWFVMSLLVLHNFGWEDGEMKGEFPLSGMCDEEPVVGVERRGVWASCNLGLGIDFMTFSLHGSTLFTTCEPSVLGLCEISVSLV